MKIVAVAFVVSTLTSLIAVFGFGYLPSSGDLNGIPGGVRAVCGAILIFGPIVALGSGIMLAIEIADKAGR